MTSVTALGPRSKAIGPKHLTALWDSSEDQAPRFLFSGSSQLLGLCPGCLCTSALLPTLAALQLFTCFFSSLTAGHLTPFTTWLPSLGLPGRRQGQDLEGPPRHCSFSFYATSSCMCPVRSTLAKLGRARGGSAGTCPSADSIRA